MLFEPPSEYFDGSDKSHEQRSLSKIPEKLEYILCYGLLWIGAVIIIGLEANTEILTHAFQSLIFSFLMTFFALIVSLFFGAKGFFIVMMVTLAISLVFGYLVSKDPYSVKLPYIYSMSEHQSKNMNLLK